MLAVAAALVSAVFYGSGDFAGGLATRRASVIRVALLTQSVSVSVIGIAVWWSQPGPPSAKAVAWGMLGGLAGACGAMALLAGFRHAVFSVAAPLSAVGAAGFSVLAGLLLGERPTGLALIGILLALPAIVGVSASARARPAAPPAGRARTAGRDRVAWRGGSGASGCAPGVHPGRRELRACRRRLLRVAVHRAQPGRLRQRLLAGALQPADRSRDHHLRGPGHPGAAPAPGRSRWLAALAGLGSAPGTIFYFVATHRGQLGVAAVISSLYPAVTIMLARVLLGERLTMIRLAGLLLAGASVALIAAGGAR